MKKMTMKIARLYLLLLSITTATVLTQAQVVLPDIQVNTSSYEDIDIDAGTKAIAVINDTVYSVWRANPTETTSNIYFSKSTNGGISFLNEVDVSTGATSMGTEMPVIAVDTDGNIYITWTGITGVNDDEWNIWFTKSTDAGSTFDEPSMITTSNAFVFSSMGVFGDNVYIFYADAANYPCADYYFVRSTNNGQSFENAVQINDMPCTGSINGFSNLTAMDIDATGNIYLAWVDGRRADGDGDIFMCKSSDNGQNFDANVMVNSISSLGADSVQYYPSITVDASQNVYVSFVDMRLGNEWPNHRVYFTKSTDGGSTFTPEALLDGYDNTCKNHSIATTEQGKLVAVMCAADVTGWGVWLRESSDGGSSFSAPVNLSSTQATTEFSDLHISTGPNEDVYAIWKDNRDGPTNVYFARTDNPVSITEASEENEYFIYPNPTNGSFVIGTPKDEMNMEVAIYNTTGQKVYEGISTLVQEMGADLSPGVYIVSFSSNGRDRMLKLLKN